MKIPNKQKSKKITTKKKPIEKSKKGKVLIVAQEIKFARLLAGNEKKSRDRVLKTLKKWLVNCFAKEHDFKENDFIRIWKGLFYAVWMSDKPLVQEELCENIASTLDTFPPEQLRYALMMTSAGYKVLAKEWFGIDLHRLDKFLMLVRRLLRGILRCLKRCQWSDESCQQFTEVMFTGDGILATDTPVYARNSTSMILHILDCYLEEICKVSNGSIPPSAVTALFTPMASLLTFSKNTEVVRAARRTFAALIRQSDEGLDYQEKQDAWKRMGCPAGGPDALELANESDDEDGTEKDDDEESSDEGEDVSDDDENGSEETESVDEENDDNVENGDDDVEGALDPRAGRVNVILNTIPVPSEELADVLRNSLAKCGSKAQKRTRIVMERLEALSSSRYPFPLVVPPREKAAGGNRSSALALVRQEQRVNKASDELGLSGLSRKQRKRLLAQSRAGVSIVEQVEAIRKTKTNGKRLAPPTTVSSEPPTKKPKQAPKESPSNKENVQNDNKNKRKKQMQKPDKPQRVIQNVPQKEKQLAPQKEKENLHKEKAREKRSLQVKNKVEQPQGTNKIDKTKQNVHIKVKENTHIKNLKNSNENVSTDKKVQNKKTNNKPGAENQSVIANKATKTSGFNKLDDNIKNKIKNYQKPTNYISIETPKKVKFVLKNNSMQAPVDYYKSVRRSPSIPFDSSKLPTKTNLKPSTPSPINPFFKKKMKLKTRF